MRGPALRRDVSEEPPHDEPAAQRRLTWEIWIVLGLSLGMSGVYSLVSIIAKLTAEGSLRSQTSTLNTSQSVREYLDLTYQLLGIVNTLVPVALVLWLLAGDTPRWAERLGLSRGGVWFRASADGPERTVAEAGTSDSSTTARGRTYWRDLAHGAGLAALIGVPGLALYIIGNRLNLTTTVVASGLGEYWWTVPVLMLQAVKNAVLEEVIVVGYLMNRLRRQSWSWRGVIVASALLRGSYHLYQGFGAFVGNAIMGLVFAEWYRRGGRVWALIVAHTILDIVSFVGYQLFQGVLDKLLGA
ncbi:CPBP family intramembrane glutamic endopeptidase [Kineosporia sp. NBRC 101731]|uniref:CPBP family intramembrane glutamic endopeptidase n=1 Tax=Kineosporia sp. NBRC 101731 TaxID=3032199 RepID=UPI003323E790